MQKNLNQYLLRVGIFLALVFIIVVLLYPVLQQAFVSNIFISNLLMLCEKPLFDRYKINNINQLKIKIRIELIRDTGGYMIQPHTDSPKKIITFLSSGHFSSCTNRPRSHGYYIYIKNI